MVVKLGACGPRADYAVLTSYIIWLISDALVRDGVELPSVVRIQRFGSAGHQPQNLGRDLWRFASKSISLLGQLKVREKHIAHVSFHGCHGVMDATGAPKELWMLWMPWTLWRLPPWTLWMLCMLSPWTPWMLCMLSPWTRHGHRLALDAMDAMDANHETTNLRGL